MGIFEGREDDGLPSEISTEDALEMVQLFLKGMTIEEIASKYRITPQEAKELIGNVTPGDLQEEGSPHRCATFSYLGTFLHGNPLQIP